MAVTMVRAAEKAFYPARIPFAVMQVDTGQNFPEVLAFQDRRVAQLGVQLIIASVRETINTVTLGSAALEDSSASTWPPTTVAAA